MLTKKGWFAEMSTLHSSNTDLMLSGLSASLSLRMTFIAYCWFAPESSPRKTLPTAPWPSWCVTKKSFSSASSRPSALLTSLDWFCWSKRTNGSWVENKLPCLFEAGRCCYGISDSVSSSCYCRLFIWWLGLSPAGCIVFRYSGDFYSRGFVHSLISIT